MPKWTPMQEAAIKQRNADVLVSAAAGSGKTAVLTERVLERILGQNGESPIELDRFLIVTFTSAAAQEMKERIQHKLYEQMNKLCEAPQDQQFMLDYLEKQLALVPQASISTIHSFCLKTIKAYFNRLEIDPNIKVGNEAELSMMKSEILEEMLDEYLEGGETAFLELAEVYGSAYGLDKLKQLILQVSTFAKSTLFPSRWLDEQVKKLSTPYQSISEMPWAESFKGQIHGTLEDLEVIYTRARSLCQAPNGPHLYQEMIDSDYEQLCKIRAYSSLEEMITCIWQLEFKALSRKKQECDPALKEQVKGYRDLAKKIIGGLQDDLAYVQDEKLLRQLPSIGRQMEILVRLIEDFETRYSEQKQDAGVVDYNDLEHLCLKLLIEPEVDDSNEVVAIHYTEVAHELSQFYREVYIDEYQDSNTVQETLLLAVAMGAADKGATRFMVGDMKQSIYRFRLANPLIFAKKYQEWTKYQESDSKTREVCIDLSQNFRSRENILQGVNDLFEQVMSVAVGELVYDEDAQLKVGNHYDEGDQTVVAEREKADEIEVHILETKDPESEEEESLAQLKDIECEAMMVAQLIDQLLKGEGNPSHIFDKDLGQYRPVEPRDIVILLRAPSSKAELFEKALMQKGIGAYADVASSFFEALEIQTMISVLKIIDNPFQDIPLLAVLRSPMVGLSLDELVLIRQINEQGCFYEALKVYMEENPELGVLGTFMKKLQDYRAESSELPVEELLATLYVETGYYSYVSMLPNGAKKKANLDLLQQYALEYETNNHGKLFGFLHYLDRLAETKEGLKEAKLVENEENLVQIMSIHKSKGLEFSVVFLCDASKKFNQQDLTQDILLHSELGLGPDFIDTTQFVKYPTLPKLALKEQIKSENISEEMRVLYVALTRAKEKLFITGTVSDLESRVKKWELFADRREKAILPLGVKRAGSYLDWIGLSLYAHEDVSYFRELIQSQPAQLVGAQSRWKVQKWSKEQLDQLEQEQRNCMDSYKETLSQWDVTQVYSEHKVEIDRRLTFDYPFRQAIAMPAKVSVSEIKRAYQQHEGVNEQSMLPASISQPVAPPRFIQEETLVGARRGILIHSIFEYLDYLTHTDEGQIKQALMQLVEERKLSDEIWQVIDIKRLSSMAQSTVVEKMRKAQYVEKEKAFIYVAPAHLVDEAYPDNEEILIQGVIDSFFVDEEGITIIDYKTDYVDPLQVEQSKEKIRQRYEKQLQLYAKALEEITNIPVAHQYIYLYNINEWMHL